MIRDAGAEPDAPAASGPFDRHFLEFHLDVLVLRTYPQQSSTFL